MIDTMDKLEVWQERVDRLAFDSETNKDADFVQELMAELRTLTVLVSVVQACRMFDRYHAFDGIKDDRCPACGGRVRVDESDPARLRIESVPMVRAS